MKNFTFTRIVGLLAMLTGIVVATDLQDKRDYVTTETYSNGGVSTYTLNGLTTTIIIGASVEGEQPVTPAAAVPTDSADDFPHDKWTYTMVQDPTTLTVTQQARTFTDFLGHTKEVPAATVTETFPAITYTTVITPLVDPTPPSNEKRDYTTTSFWTETVTETLSVPAVTFSLTTTTETLPPQTYTNTWTRIVTTHITVIEPTPTTLNTVVTQTVTN
ncbi:hypothetical protein PFICI_07179 [Pestalotiopsis fici W106-1]|uniref:Yeast cell wall synthesis Kre9/Knh1 C-terminal domain-containing protein n=1 Tax=Pestalotiopsis fici (strain W106-1 / CGMCC3.15140) TaxID=1229662 RepID=W3X9U5_PESFW|nr:uncharacterized protein PFICI_07179 [Pestalotiopsis fici W106-1]ETS82177.1 hypothetical protein PFICI_07179 [Pestalotiopsis fici W106-1]